MTKMTTLEVAEYMLATSRYYTAAILARELGVPISVASGKLYNIKYCKKYKTDLKSNPVAVRVLDISGICYKAQIWHKLLRSNWSD